MTKRKKRIPVITLWASNRRKHEQIQELVVATMRSALAKTSRALTQGEYNGKRFKMVETGNIAKSITSGTKALQQLLLGEIDDIRIIQLLAESEYAVRTFEIFDVCTIRELLNAEPARLGLIMESFENSRMEIPLVVRFMTEETLANKLRFSLQK